MSLPIVNNSYIFIKNWWELDLTPELLERQLDMRHWSYRSTVTNKVFGTASTSSGSRTHVPTLAVYSEVCVWRKTSCSYNC
jgi:hypothetical protein